MSIKKIKRLECHCERCGNTWATIREAPPKVCPVCKSSKWNQPVKVKAGGRK